MASVFIDSILWFLKLKLTILFQVGTYGRKMQYESKFKRLKFTKQEILIRASGLEKI